MAALDEVREREIEIDMELSPIEECYSFLQRCGVAVAREEMETVDSLRYTFKNLLTQAVSIIVLLSTCGWSVRLSLCRVRSRAT